MTARKRSRSTLDNSAENRRQPSARSSAAVKRWVTEQCEIEALTESCVAMDRGQFAEDVELARAVFQRFPALVTAPFFPIDLLNDLKRANGDADYNPDEKCELSIAKCLDPDNLIKNRQLATSTVHGRRAS